MALHDESRPPSRCPLATREAGGRASLATLAVGLLLALSVPVAVRAEPARVRAAARTIDITPSDGLPLWGYGGRRDLPATGAHDPLLASILLLEIGEERVAIVGLDAGRGPARKTMAALRERARELAGVDHIYVVASHTHHAPCLELEEVEPTATWIRSMVERIASTLAECRKEAKPAVIRVASGTCDRSRNRHTRIEPKPVDRVMTVLRVDAVEGGATIATVVNWAAHPTTRPAIPIEYSADFPGPLRRSVAERLGGTCVYLQGAAGDVSTDRRGQDTEAFAKAVADDVVRLAGEAKPLELEAGASFRSRAREFRFERLRIRLDEPLTYWKYVAAFFRALVDAYVEEYRDGVRPGLEVALIGDDLGLVAVSGEFFAAHAIRLRERARLPHLLFLGCTNGYHQYFPTIEAAAEGGYGADPTVSPVEIGAGERMMDQALIWLHEFRAPTTAEDRTP